MNNHHRIKFVLPHKGIFKVNGPSDPLDYYYRPLVGKLYVKRIQQGLDLLKPPYESIMDFGSGSGLLLPSLARHAKRISAVDIIADPRLVRESLRKLNLTADLYQQDITSLNLSAQSFDLIVAFSIFEHLREPEPVVKKLHHLLLPGGSLLVGMPRVDKLMEKLFVAIGFNGINEHHVINYKDFLKTSLKYFKLEKMVSLPKFLPKSLGLYFNMLLKKKS